MLTMVIIVVDYFLQLAFNNNIFVNISLPSLFGCLYFNFTLLNFEKLGCMKEIMPLNGIHGVWDCTIIIEECVFIICV